MAVMFGYMGERRWGTRHDHRTKPNIQVVYVQGDAGDDDGV